MTQDEIAAMNKTINANPKLVRGDCPVCKGSRSLIFQGSSWLTVLHLSNRWVCEVCGSRGYALMELVCKGQVTEKRCAGADWPDT